VITQVDNYGVHWDGAVAWLLQGRKGNNFVGLKAQCPFVVKKGMCNHLVPAAAPIPDRIHWEAWSKISPDPLVQAMFPIPREGGKNIFFVDDPFDALGLHLSTLSRLSSPINQVIKPIWLVKIKDLEVELKSSNIQPLVLVQANQKSQALVDTLSKLAIYMPRTVIILGKPEVVVRSPIQRITTNINEADLQEVLTLPLENIGATLLRRHARREPLDAKIETREDKRARQIRERSSK